MTRQPRMRTRPTMETVAALAGVSKITVSRALRGSELVRQEVRDRITAAASSVGYRIHTAARSLRTKETRTIYIVVGPAGQGAPGDVAMPPLPLIQALIECLAPAGYGIHLAGLDQFAASGGSGADAALIWAQGPDESYLGLPARFDLPVLVWGEAAPRIDAPRFASDNRMGGRLAASHLIACGRSRLIFLGETGQAGVATQLAGFREVLASSDAVLVDVVACPFNAEGASATARSLAERDIVFDGVFATSDIIASAICHALEEKGMSVPNDVCIVGFGDEPIAAMHRPSISSIGFDAAAVGRALGASLMELLQGRDVEEVCLLPQFLIERGTSGLRTSAV